MKRFVRIGMQIQEKDGHFRTDGLNVFHYKDSHGCNTCTSGFWVYETERKALEELIEDLEFSLEQAQKRIVEVEEVENG